MSLWEPIEKFLESYESKVARAHKNIVVVALANKLRVSPSPALLGDLKQLLGPACVV